MQSQGLCRAFPRTTVGRHPFRSPHLTSCPFPPVLPPENQHGSFSPRFPFCAADSRVLCSLHFPNRPLESNISLAPASTLGLPKALIPAQPPQAFQRGTRKNRKQASIPPFFFFFWQEDSGCQEPEERREGVARGSGCSLACGSSGDAGGRPRLPAACVRGPEAPPEKTLARLGERNSYSSSLPPP